MTETVQQSERVAEACDSRLPSGRAVGCTDLLGHGVGRHKLGLYWHECRDGDDGAREIYDRHYSRYIYADGRKPKLFVGPGEKMVLITEDGDAVWCWRKFKDASGQQGVNNAIFRNEGTILSSLLIMDAEQLAWQRWPGERLYTYVKPTGIRSTNPGACYKKAGWRVCGVTKWNKLVILEKCPNAELSGGGDNPKGTDAK